MIQHSPLPHVNGYNLRKYVGVRRYIRSEGVDSTAVIDDQEKERKFLFGCGVQGFRHPSVLRRSLTEKHDCHPAKKKKKGNATHHSEPATFQENIHVYVHKQTHKLFNTTASS